MWSETLLLWMFTGDSCMVPESFCLRWVEMFQAEHNNYAALMQNVHITT